VGTIKSGQIKTLSILFLYLLLIIIFSCKKDDNREKFKGNQAILKKVSYRKGYLGISLPADFRAFSEDSPWNTPIPENPEIDPASDLMINNLKYKAKMLKGNLTKWTIPLFIIDSKESPKVNVKTSAKYLNLEVDPDRNRVAEGLPLPEGIWPDPEEDGHMLLVDPKLRKSWDFSGAKRLSDKSWIASGITIWDLNGPGYRKPFSGENWWTYGVRGSGFPLIAGLIRPEEIESGNISHALAFASPINRKSTYSGGSPQVCSPPASKTDGYGIGYEYIPEGARLQLDPELDLNLLNISPATKVIARAMQVYGMYNADNAAAFTIYFQNLGPDGGKWIKYKFFKDLKNIPIEKFRVLKCNLVNRK
jgi:hypothetical protein